MSGSADQFPLRLPDGMRDQIKAAAKANGRSMNAEFVHRLESYRSAGSITVEVDTSQVDDALAAVERLTAAAEKAFEACQRLGIKAGAS